MRTIYFSGNYNKYRVPDNSTEFSDTKLFFYMITPSRVYFRQLWTSLRALLVKIYPTTSHSTFPERRPCQENCIFILSGRFTQQN